MYKIGKLTVSYEWKLPQGCWVIYVRRNGEEIRFNEGGGGPGKNEDIIKTRAAMLAHLIEDEIGETARNIQRDAYGAGYVAGQGLKGDAY